MTAIFRVPKEQVPRPQPKKRKPVGSKQIEADGKD